VSRSAAIRPLLLGLIGTIPGCNDLTVPAQALPSFITIVKGDRQIGEVGTPLPDSLIVRVTDGTGRPVQDVVVRFVPLGVAADGQVIPDTASTDPDGQAGTRWVLSSGAGPVQLEAQVSLGRGDPLTITFSATALAGPAAIIHALRGDGQSATAGALLSDSLVARVTDRFGNPIPGASIAWHTGDGGTVSDAETSTDANGHAGVAWRLGNLSGSQTAQATVAGLSGSPLTFTATALPGAAVALLKVFGDGQTAPAGTLLTDSVVAQLVDGLGNGVPGRSINWVVSAGAGSTTPATGTTDATGRAFTRWTLGTGAGTQVMNAVVSGLQPAEFTATAVAQSAGKLGAASATALAGVAGQPVTPPPAVRVTDGIGNPVRGVTVSFAVRGSGGVVANRTGQGSVVTVATDASGIAAVTSWTLGPVAGSDTLEASAVGSNGPLQGSPVRFIALGVPGPASRLAFLQQPTTTTVGRQMSPPVTVAVADLNGNLVSSFSGTVTLSLGSSPPGGTLGGPTTAGVVGGIATFAGLTLGPAGSGYTLVASAPLISPAASVSFDVTAGTVPRLTLVTQPSDTAANGVRFPRQPVVRLEDGFGNPLSQPAVPITVSLLTGGGSLGGTATVATAANGVASFTDLSIIGLVGPRTLLFSAPGYQAVSPTPVVLVAGPATAIALEAGGGQTTNVGTSVTIPPAVRVTDQAGNPVAGVAVTFAVTAGGGSLTGPNPVSNAQGIAVVGSWQLGPTKGTNSLTATAPGLAGSPVVINAIGRFAYLGLWVGAEFSCGISTAGSPYCWGRNNVGQIGNGGTTDQTVPVPVAGGLAFPAIGLGYEHACGLTATGAAYCWGLNTGGQLGDGTTTNRPTPVPVAGGLAFLSIEGGDAHTCALTAAGAAYCWGQNIRGQLGDGTTTARLTPVPVAGGISFRALALGTQFSCGLATSGTIYCWGLNADGQLGNGGKPNRPTPTAVVGTGWTAVAAGAQFACALGAGGAASCWGRNDKGQIGDGKKPNPNQPVAVAGGLAFTRLDAGGKHACGVTATGAAYCWGENGDGELGDGTITDRPVPTAVQGGNLFATVSTGGLHTLALTPAGVAYGWGRDANGQLGTGTPTAKLTPVPVREP
jgi:alpha-tubulin suppressor-like RCC1 family protein